MGRFGIFAKGLLVSSFLSIAVTAASAQVPPVGTDGSTTGGWTVTKNTAQVCIPGVGCYYGGSNFAGATAGVSNFSGAFLSVQIDNASCRVLGIAEGSFGALIMIVAGLVAIVAGALGAYKAALTTIAIGTGAWILRPIVNLFFPISCGGN